MTAPRQVVAGRAYMLTRRCAQRQLLLRPDDVTNESFIYCLGVAARKFGIHVHAVMVMSNHYHVVVTDVLGNYPEFLHYLNSLLARCLNTHRRRGENFWAVEQPGVLYLADAAAVLDKTVYTLGNPVAAHLVQRTVDWPGVSSLRAQLTHGEMRARRPRHFFRESGSMPEEVTLAITQPEQFQHLTAGEWNELVQGELFRREKVAEAERAESGRRVVGRKKVLTQDPFSAPKSAEPKGGVVPRVATKNRWLRIERLQRDKAFQKLYRAAYALWTAGAQACFPWGTYKLRVQSRVPCDPPPTAAPQLQPAC